MVKQAALLTQLAGEVSWVFLEDYSPLPISLLPTPPLMNTVGGA